MNMEQVEQIEDLLSRMEGNAILVRRVVEDLEGCDERVMLEHLAVTGIELNFQMSKILENFRTAQKGI